MIVSMQSHRKRRAFTLTELAIVLAVIGGLFAVIWAAASDVSMSNKVRVANTQLVAIAQNIRTIFIEQGGVRGSPTSLTPALDRLKVFPLEMRQNLNADSGIIFHPWSQTVDAVTGLGTVLVAADDCTGTSAGDNTTPEPCFVVRMILLPQKACVQLLTVSSLLNTGLQSVWVNGVSVPLPVDTNTATTNCSAITTATNKVEWIYLLRDKS